jgi:hypothetical protein
LLVFSNRRIIYRSILLGTAAVLIASRTLFLRVHNTSVNQIADPRSTIYTDSGSRLSYFFDGLTYVHPRFARGANPYLGIPPKPSWVYDHFSRAFNSLGVFLGFSVVHAQVGECTGIYQANDVGHCGTGCGTTYPTTKYDGSRPCYGSQFIGYVCHNGEGWSLTTPGFYSCLRTGVEGCSGT